MSDQTVHLTVHICNVYRQYIRLFFSFNRKPQLRALRHGPNKGIYTSKINRAKGVLPIVAKYTAFEGKSEILGISWRKGVKVTNVLITNVIDAIEI